MPLFHRSKSLLLLTTLTVALFSSCNFGPSAIKPPSISPGGAASKAMELYDKNADGKIAGPELDSAPALKAAMATLDTDGDKAVSSDEIAARIKSWQNSPAALTSLKANVTLDGQPLGGAEVTFDPDPSLGADIKAAKGTTNMYGDVTPDIPADQRPSSKYPGGTQLGMYIIRITKSVNGKETIPARYNTQSTLGQEVAYDDPAFKNRSIAFHLKSTP